MEVEQQGAVPEKVQQASAEVEKDEEEEEEEEEKGPRGQAAVGRRVGVFWDGEDKFFFGRIVAYDGRCLKPYKVVYDDEESEWEREDALDFEAEARRARGEDLDGAKPPKKRKRSRTPTEASKNKLKNKNMSKNKKPRRGSVRREKRLKKDANLIGKKVKVYWNGERQYYFGTIAKVRMDDASSSSSKASVFVKYDDGDKEWENLNEVRFVNNEESEIFDFEIVSHVGENDATQQGNDDEFAKNEERIDAGRQRETKTAGTAKQILELAPEELDDVIGRRVEYIPETVPFKLLNSNEVEVPASLELSKGQIVIYHGETKPREKRYTFVPMHLEKEFGRVELEKGLIVTYLTKDAQSPLLQKRFKKGDAVSVEKLLRAGAKMEGLKIFEDRDIFEAALTQTSKQGQFDMLRMLLTTDLNFKMKGETVEKLFKEVAEDLKNHQLLRCLLDNVLNKVKAFTEKDRDAVFSFCTEYVVKLHEKELERIDQMLFDTLSNNSFGFSLDRHAKVSDQHLKAPVARTKLVLHEATPLLHAITKGNVEMAIRLLEKELESNEQLSDLHWTYELNEEIWGESEEIWNPRGFPMRLVLFLFAMNRSSSDALVRLLKTMQDRGIFELNGSESVKPALLFLCSLRDKKNRPRIRNMMQALIIKAGVDVNVVHKEETPLTVCVKNMNAIFINVLVETGKVDVNLKDPLGLAIELNHSDEAEVLMKCGAKLKSDRFPESAGLIAKPELLPQILKQIPPEDKPQALGKMLADLCKKLSEGGNEPNVENSVELLLANGADPLFSQSTGAGGDFACQQPLFSCAKANRLVLVKKMINNGGKKIDVNKCFDAHSGLSLLVWACQEGRRELVQVLVDAGANVVSSCGPKLKPTNALVSTVCRIQDSALFKALIKAPSADLSWRSPNGGTILHFAAALPSTSVLKVLLNEDVKISVKDNVGRTPVVWATITQNSEALRLLASHGADLDEPDNDGMSPLDHAIEKGLEKAAVLLVDLGANLKK